MPAIPVILPNGTQFSLDEAASNLGGGMCYAAADYHRLGRQVPNGSLQPVQGDAFWMYLVQREVDSLDISGIFSVVALMNPRVPDLLRARWMLQHEWVRIKRDLDSGFLAQIALVNFVSVDARQLGANLAQVCAYGYDHDVDTGTVTLRVYDPRLPGDSGAALTFETEAVDSLLHLQHTRELALRAFFKTAYSVKTPPV